MASLQAAATHNEHPESSRLPRVSASSNPIETLQSVTTYLTAQGVPSSAIIGNHAHAALYHQHCTVPFAAPTGVAATFMNSLPPQAQNRTSLIHDHTVGVRLLSSQADLDCALVTFQPFPSDPRLLVVPLQYDSLFKISTLLGDGVCVCVCGSLLAVIRVRRLCDTCGVPSERPLIRRCPQGIPKAYPKVTTAPAIISEVRCCSPDRRSYRPLLSHVSRRRSPPSFRASRWVRVGRGRWRMGVCLNVLMLSVRHQPNATR